MIEDISIVVDTFNPSGIRVRASQLLLYTSSGCHVASTELGLWKNRDLERAIIVVFDPLLLDRVPSQTKTWRLFLFIICT